MGIRAMFRSLPSRINQTSLDALGGWTFESECPTPRKAVCLAVPHTDNLDAVLLVLLARSIDMTVSWMIKDTWDHPPIGPLIRHVGGVPINRSRANGMVDQMVEQFRRRDDFYLIIPPEGTRSPAKYWKSGFYRIAHQAEVPVVPGYLDYRRRVGGFGEPMMLTGKIKHDMDRIREFYANLGGSGLARYPHKFGPIRLREED